MVKFIYIEYKQLIRNTGYKFLCGFLCKRRNQNIFGLYAFFDNKINNPLNKGKGLARSWTCDYKSRPARVLYNFFLFFVGLPEIKHY